MLETLVTVVVSDRSGFRRVCMRAQSRPFVDLSLTTGTGDGPTLTPNFSHLQAPMVLNPESKYPNRRAYVLKLRSDASPEALAGRLENLVTGARLEFASGHELLESIGRDLEIRAGEPSAEGEHN